MVTDAAGNPGRRSEKRLGQIVTTKGACDRALRPTADAATAPAEGNDGGFLFGARQIADYLGTNTRKVYYLIESGVLPIRKPAAERGAPDKAA